jgi:hypothetical protein
MTFTLSVDDVRSLGREIGGVLVFSSFSGCILAYGVIRLLELFAHLLGGIAKRFRGRSQVKQ